MLALAAVVVLGAQSWTEDQGEAGTEADALALGVDVAAKVGEPSGPALSGDELEATATTIAKGLRCPACQGLSIEDSPAETARNMKRQVRAMVAAGYDREQIEAYFVAAYGEFVLMAPKAEGFNLVVWLAPAVLVFGGLIWVFGFVGRHGGSTPSRQLENENENENEIENEIENENENESETEDDYLKRLREEVDRA